MDLCGLKSQVRQHVPAPSVGIPWTAVDPGKRVGSASGAEGRRFESCRGTASTSTAIEPPVELRRRVLAAVASHSDRRFLWPSTILAAAAAVAIGLAAVGVELALRPANAPSIAAQVFAAPDVRTTSEPIPTGGTATVVYSHEKNAGILVMNNVQPPAPGTVY